MSLGKIARRVALGFALVGSVSLGACSGGNGALPTTTAAATQQIAHGGALQPQSCAGTLIDPRTHVKRNTTMGCCSPAATTCVIVAPPTGGGGGGVAGGGGSGGGGTGSCPGCGGLGGVIAYPGGKAAPTKQCGVSAAAPGPTVGQVLDNAPDTPPSPTGGTSQSSNEVNNILYLTAGTGAGSGATFNTVYGFVSVTFNGEVWFTPALALPLYGGQLNIRLGSGTTTAKTLGASQVQQWINTWVQQNPSAPAAVVAALKGFGAGISSAGGSLSENACFAGGAWNGSGGENV